MNSRILEIIEERQALYKRLAALNKEEKEILTGKVRINKEKRVLVIDPTTSHTTLSPAARKPRRSEYEKIVEEYLENLEMELQAEREDIENTEAPIFLLLMAELSVATIVEGLQKKYPKRFGDKKAESIAYRVRRTEAWKKFKKERQPQYEIELSKKSTILNNPLNRNIPLDHGVHVIKGR